MQKIGKRVRETRIKRGLSQEQLAEASKVNLRTIQRIENDETTPRGSTCKLIFDVLDIELIETEKQPISKYLIWSLFLTLLIIISSFIGWMRYIIGYDQFGEKVFKILTGWDGSVRYNELNFHNWMLSLCALSLGGVVVANSLGLIENKRRYILLPLVYFFGYFCAFVWERHTRFFTIMPGIFIIIVASTLLVIAYRKEFLVEIGLSVFLVFSPIISVLLFIQPDFERSSFLGKIVYVVVIGFFIVIDFFIIRRFVRARRINGGSEMADQKKTKHFT